MSRERVDAERRSSSDKVMRTMGLALERRRIWTQGLAGGPTEAVPLSAKLIPDARHNTEQYANKRVECDHGRLKAGLRPMRGLKRDRAESIVLRGRAFIQNVRRGHYELGADARNHLRVAAAFDELTQAI